MDNLVTQLRDRFSEHFNKGNEVIDESFAHVPPRWVRARKEPLLLYRLVYLLAKPLFLLRNGSSTSKDGSKKKKNSEAEAQAMGIEKYVPHRGENTRTTANSSGGGEEKKEEASAEEAAQPTSSPEQAATLVSDQQAKAEEQGLRVPESNLRQRRTVQGDIDGDDEAIDPRPTITENGQ